MKIWVEVTNKRNLEATIQRVLQEKHIKSDTSSDSITSRKEQGGNKVDKKSGSHRKFRRRLAWCFIGLCICVLIGMTILQGINSAELSAMSDLKDTRLIAYEGQIPTAKRIGLLFSIHDEQSYQNAKAAIPMSDDLKAIYFINEHYYGDDIPDVSVVVNNILYEITDAPQAKFLIYLTRSDRTGIKQYIVQATYTGAKLVDLQVLN